VSPYTVGTGSGLGANDGGSRGVIALILVGYGEGLFLSYQMMVALGAA
jgi:hypothetical protein